MIICGSILLAVVGIGLAIGIAKTLGETGVMLLILAPFLGLIFGGGAWILGLFFFDFLRSFWGFAGCVGGATILIQLVTLR